MAPALAGRDPSLLPTVTRINRTEIGYRSGTGGNVESGRDTAGRDVLAESLMLTGDENIIDIDVAVFWRISNAPDFLFNTANPEILVRGVAESSMREVIGRTPIQPALGPLRGQIETDVLKQTQEILDRYKAGVEITQVQLQKVDPPAAVIESFRDVQRANTDAERMRNEAEAYRNDIVPRARGDAARIVAEGAGRQSRLGRPGNRPDAALRQRAESVSGSQRRHTAPDYLDTMADVLSRSQPLVVDDKLKGLVPFLPLNLPPPAGPRPRPGTRRPTVLAIPGSHRRCTPDQPQSAGLSRLLLVVLVVARQRPACSPSTQTEQVLVVQFGQIVRPIEKPGLHAKLPFIQNVIDFDKRLLSVELPGEEVILGDQRRLIVDTFTVFRITDPLNFYQAIGPVPDDIRGRLNSIVTGSLRRVLGNNKLLDVLSADRDRIMSTHSRPGEHRDAEFRRHRRRRAHPPRRPAGGKHPGDPVADAVRTPAHRGPGPCRGCRSLGQDQGRCRTRTHRAAGRRTATADNLRGEGEAEATRIYAQAVRSGPRLLRDLAHASGLPRYLRQSALHRLRRAYARQRLSCRLPPGSAVVDAVGRAPTGSP